MSSAVRKTLANTEYITLLIQQAGVTIFRSLGSRYTR